jgi:hypothetical protein
MSTLEATDPTVSYGIPSEFTPERWSDFSDGFVAILVLKFAVRKPNKPHDLSTEIPRDHRGPFALRGGGYR